MIDISAILSLAPEIVHRICMETELPDVKQLRLTCEKMAALLEPCIYRTVSLSINRSNMDDGVRKVEVLAASTHPSRFACRVLFIGSLSPSYDPVYRGCRVAIIRPPKDLPEVTNVEEKLNVHLFDALTSLRGVQYVKWSPTCKDGHSIHRIVMNSLKILTSLRRLEIIFPDCEIPLELDNLRGLHEISISTQNTSRVKQALILDNVAKAISRNPNLTSINVSAIRQFGHMADKSQSLHQLFKYYPTSASPLRLHNLRLEGCLTRFDKITIPHFRHLTSLTLLSVVNDFGVNSLAQAGQHTSPDVLALFEERKRYSSCAEDTWKALTAAQVRLENIVIDDIPQYFLDYLLSYSGLKHLCLISPGSLTSGFSDGESSDAMAALFFKQPLNNHAGSLENLDIQAAYEGLWCFGEHNHNAISKLTKLKHLCISVRISDLGDYRNKNWEKNSVAKRDAIHELIDLTANYMPDIESIDVRSAARERHHTSGSMLFNRNRTGIRDSVENYASPPGCKHIPMIRLRIGGQIYVGKRTRPSESEQKSLQSDGQAQGSGILKYIARTTIKWPCQTQRSDDIIGSIRLQNLY